jgi:RNA polymerase sigma-70 factor (ECF subfamily)
MYSMTSAHCAGDPDELAPTRQSLLERLRDLDDSAAWQEFFDTYWKLIYASAIRFGLSDDEAEEVVQETVIGIARKMDTFQYQPQTCSFKGWLMHVTRRRIIDRFRKRQSRRGVHIPLPADTGTTEAEQPVQLRDDAAERAFEGLWDEEWQKNLIDAAMERVKRKVPAKQYQIFYLHSVKNMPGRDISKLLGVSTAKVYVVRHRIGRLVKREVQTLATQQSLVSPIEKAS